MRLTARVKKQVFCMRLTADMRLITMCAQQPEFTVLKLYIPDKFHNQNQQHKLDMTFYNNM